MADYRKVARAKARRYGLDPNVFLRQIQQESGFNPNARSPAGATGIAQIMPGTAKGWGVNPNDPVASLDAAAKNMAKYVKQYGGSYKKALAAYNAGPGAVAKYNGVPPYRETQDYVRKILSGQNPSSSSSSASTTTSRTVTTPSNNRLQSVLTQAASTPGRIDATQLAMAMLTDRANPNTRTVTQPGSQPAARGRGKVQFAAGADRPGVRTAGHVKNFLGQVSAIAGVPITVGTGTNHRQMTKSGNQSDHWDGNGADVPASGKQLIRLGQAALIAAGMDPKKARLQTGGLFNLKHNGRRVQVIFNAADHYDHLHTGIR